MATMEVRKQHMLTLVPEPILWSFISSNELAAQPALLVGRIAARKDCRQRLLI